MEYTLATTFTRNKAQFRQLRRDEATPNRPAQAIYERVHFDTGTPRVVSFEVVQIKVMSERTIAGNFIPEHEEYPGDEKFGRIAWCFPTLEAAEIRYNNLLNKEPING